MGAALLSLLLGGLNLAKAGWETFCAFLSKLDGRGWCELGCGLVAALVILHFATDARHWRKQDARDVKALQVEKAHEAEIARQAVDLKTRIDTLTLNVTKVIKDRADAENDRIAADADAIRLRGPGKATCPRDASAPAAPVRRDETAPAGADAGSEVPSGDRAAVSWTWLVGVIQEHDQMRNELQAVEDQHAQLEKAWPKGTAK